MTATLPPPNVAVTDPNLNVTVPWYDFFRAVGNAANQTTLFNVKDYGAKGDGVTDDTAAVQAAVDAMRAAMVELYNVNHTTYPWLGVSPGYLFFPPGIYLITASIDMQDMNGRTLGDDTANCQGWGIIGQGATIMASMTSGSVFDCLGSSDGRFSDFSIMGDPGNVPPCGILVGRINHDNTPAGSHLFDRVFFSGNFTSAAIFNNAGEGNCYLRVSVHNQTTNAAAFGIVTDGYHHLTLPTVYSSSFPANSDDSCIQHTFVSCDVLCDHGIPYYFGNSAQINMIGSNYGVCASQPAVRFDQGGINTLFSNNHFNMNVEGTPTAFMNVTRLTTPGTIQFRDFEIRDHGGLESTAIVNALTTMVTNLTISNSNIFHNSTAPVSLGTVTWNHQQLNGIRYNDWDYGTVLGNDTSTFFDISGSSLQTPVVTVIASSNTSGMVWLQCNGSPACSNIAVGLNLHTTTGALTGTSGTTGCVTLSASSLGRIYVENRTGGSQAIALKAMSV